jgi:hypothetical protein
VLTPLIHVGQVLEAPLPGKPYTAIRLVTV